MLIVPLLVGIAASHPTPWQLVLGATALSGYLASATIQAWSRARRAPAYRAPVLAYASTFAVLGLALVAAFPGLLVGVVVVAPAAAIVLVGARPGTRRELANSLAQVTQALVLVPAAAYVSDSFDLVRVTAGTAVAGGYLVGTVLAVRSVLRERGNDAFAAASIGFHGGLAIAAIAVLPAAYGWLAVGLTLRAIGLPLAQRRLARGARPLRPVHVGLIETVAAVAVVAVAFGSPVQPSAPSGLGQPEVVVVSVELGHRRGSRPALGREPGQPLEVALAGRPGGEVDEERHRLAGIVPEAVDPAGGDVDEIAARGVDPGPTIEDLHGPDEDVERLGHRPVEVRARAATCGAHRVAEQPEQAVG